LVLVSQNPRLFSINECRCKDVGKCVNLGGEAQKMVAWKCAQQGRTIPEGRTVVCEKIIKRKQQSPSWSLRDKLLGSPGVVHAIALPPKVQLEQDCGVLKQGALSEKLRLIGRSNNVKTRLKEEKQYGSGSHEGRNTCYESEKLTTQGVDTERRKINPANAKVPRASLLDRALPSREEHLRVGKMIKDTQNARGETHTWSGSPRGLGGGNAEKRSSEA